VDSPESWSWTQAMSSSPHPSSTALSNTALAAMNTGGADAGRALLDLLEDGMQGVDRPGSRRPRSLPHDRTALFQIADAPMELSRVC
jgi:hypothetical protein